MNSEDSISAILHSIQLNNNNDNDDNSNNYNIFAFLFFYISFCFFFGFICLFQRGIPTNACIIYFSIKKGEVMVIFEILDNNDEDNSINNEDNNDEEATTRGIQKQKRFSQKLSKFKGKHLFLRLIFKKVAGFRSSVLLKIDFNQVFSCEFAKFLRTPFLHNINM